jgi:phage terminase large subunit GpA-like protein
LVEARGWLADVLVKGIKTEITHESLVEWAEKTRYIGAGLSPMDGLFSWSVTPYLEEIADCFSETSPVQEVAVMKGARVGFTVGVLENWIGYTIGTAPAPFLYVGADKESAEEVMETRIGPMLELSGLAGKIFAPVLRSGSRATGDTKARKDFAGGRLRAIGPNSGAKLRGNGFSRLGLDEIDAWQQEVGTARGKRKSEGSTLSVILRRSDEYEQSRKILYGSTPLTKSSSLIEPLFLAGDQRRYFVPCKHCGAMQYLKWGGIKFERYDDGRPKIETVHYECESCGGAWVNADKVNFMKSRRQGGVAEWRPTAEPKRRGMRSYHLPSFYSPVGFRSWESIVEEWCEATGDPTKLQTIVNTVFGETWEEKGFTPDYVKIMTRRESITETDLAAWPARGAWPEGALLWTLGVDTQDDRIECEAVAWGRNKESWSMGYHVFHGDTADLNSAAWAGLADLVTDRYGDKPMMIALQDSQGHRTTEVYEFAEGYLSDRGQLIPCSGDAPKTSKKMFQLFNVAGYAIRRADLQVDQLKAELYTMLNAVMPEQGLVPRGLCHFPQEYGESYFKGLMSEERVKERLPSGGFRTVWRKIRGRGRNEPLDCRVYALGALYVFKHLILEEAEDDVLPWDIFWDWCEQELA